MDDRYADQSTFLRHRSPVSRHTRSPLTIGHFPRAAAYNAQADPLAMQQIAQALGTGTAPLGLFELGHAVNAQMALRDLGLAESDLDRAADLAVQKPYWNPRPVEREAIRDLLQMAWSGNPPE